ncbi:MAG: hypothetical protein RL301_40 [Actinomycetota bacterium]
MRVGLVGYGLAGKVFHAPLISAAGMELVGIVTNNAERIAQAKSDYPNAKICRDVAELISIGIDLMVVASVNTEHVPNAKAAISAKIPVVVDKPVAITESETAELFTFAEENGVALHPFFNRLWDSDTLTIKAKMDLIGKPHRFDGRFERFRPELNRGSWREEAKPEEGGGLLLDLQTHLVSTAISCFGNAQLKYANLHNVRGGLAEDDVLIVLEHESGVVSSLAVSAVAGATGPRARLLGSKGAIVVNELDPQEGLLKDGNYLTGNRKSVTELHRGDEITEIQSEAGNYVEFYKLIKNGQVPVSKDLALQVAHILDQAKRYG